MCKCFCELQFISNSELLYNWYVKHYKTIIIISRKRLSRKTEAIKEQDLNPKPIKCQKPNMPKKKASSSQKQYIAYEYVLSNAKTMALN